MTPQLNSPTIVFALIKAKEQTEKKINFETAVEESIDEALTTLGEDVKKAVYRYLERKCNIKKEQIPIMVVDFTLAVESIFGDAAKLVELKIIEKLQDKFKGFIYKPKSKEIFFVEYLLALEEYLN